MRGPRCVSFSTWRALASYSASDHQVTVRDGQTGATIVTLRPRARAAASPIGAVADVALAWSADGKQLAALDARGGAIDVWTLP